MLYKTCVLGFYVKIPHTKKTLVFTLVQMWPPLVEKVHFSLPGRRGGGDIYKYKITFSPLSPKYYVSNNEIPRF